MHNERAEDATYENEVALSRPRPRAGRIHVNTLHIDPPRPAFGGPYAPGDFGLAPPMAMAIRQSPAWCAHVDQVRLDHYRRQVAAFKIRF